MKVASKKLCGILLSLVVLIALSLPLGTAQMATTVKPQVKIGPKEDAQIPAGNIKVMANVTNFKQVEDIWLKSPMT